MRADVAGARSPSEPAAVGEPHHAGVLRGPARPARRPRTTTKHGVGRVRLGLISAAELSIASARAHAPTNASWVIWRRCRTRALPAVDVLRYSTALNYTVLGVDPDIVRHLMRRGATSPLAALTDRGREVLAPAETRRTTGCRLSLSAHRDAGPIVRQ